MGKGRQKDWEKVREEKNENEKVKKAEDRKGERRNEDKN